MKRFNNILCVVAPGTGRKPALERAVTLAENNQASLMVIDVTARVRAGVGMPEGGPASADMQAAIVSAHEQELYALIEPYHQRINVQAKVLTGTPFLEIIREVLRNRRDLVIKTAETRGGSPWPALVWPDSSWATPRRRFSTRSTAPCLRSSRPAL